MNIWIILRNLKKNCQEKKKFHSSLTNRKVNDEEYEHVLNVYNIFEIKAMKGYHHLYLECDILFLADVFEKLRNNSLKNYGLCPKSLLERTMFKLGYNA